MYTRISHPHDALFKEFLAHNPVREEIISTCLPKHILTKLDLSTITSINKSYIDQKLREYESDVLFSVKNKSGENNFIYILIEHQRKPDKFLPARIFNYKAKIIIDYLKQYPLAKYIPTVCSIVYYNGDKPYPYSLDFFELFSEPDIMRDSIFSPLNLYDLNTISDNTIRQRTFMSLMDYCMKYAPRKKFTEKIEEFCQIVYKAQQTETEVSNLIIIMFKYIINVVSDLDCGEVMNMLRDNLPEGRAKEQFLSMGEGIWEDGKQTGIKEGKLEGIREGELKGIKKGGRETRQEIANNAYKCGVSLNIISKMTGYSLDDLNQILKVTEIL